MCIVHESQFEKKVWHHTTFLAGVPSFARPCTGADPEVMDTVDRREFGKPGVLSSHQPFAFAAPGWPTVLAGALFWALGAQVRAAGRRQSHTSERPIVSYNDAYSLRKASQSVINTPNYVEAATYSTP